MTADRLANRQKMPGKDPNRQGFSLVEIMVIIVVVGILATVSAPPIYRYVQSNRLQTNADRMAADMQYARSLSIANSEILRFAATPTGYKLTNANTGALIRETDFRKGMSLALTQTKDFYPWGMADAAVFNITNGAGTTQINLLPTGIVEVH